MLISKTDTKNYEAEEVSTCDTLPPYPNTESYNEKQNTIKNDKSNDGRCELYLKYR